jgi:hypothetical protein
LCFVPKVREQNAPFLAAERTGPSYRGLICAVDKPGTSGERVRAESNVRSGLSVGWDRLLAADKGGADSFVGQNRSGAINYRGDSLLHLVAILQRSGGVTSTAKRLEEIISHTGR